MLLILQTNYRYDTKWYRITPSNVKVRYFSLETTFFFQLITKHCRRFTDLYINPWYNFQTSFCASSRFSLSLSHSFDEKAKTCVSQNTISNKHSLFAGNNKVGRNFLYVCNAFISGIISACVAIYLTYRYIWSRLEQSILLL